MNVLKWLAICVIALSLSGCGFHLRDQADLPAQMAKTQIVVDDRDSALVRRLMTFLEQEGVQIVRGNEASAILEIPMDQVVTEVLTIGNNARVQEYRISHTVQFRLMDAAGQELLTMQTLQQSREIIFDEQKILATSREQEYVKKDLAETLTRMMMARLESVGHTVSPSSG